MELNVVKIDLCGSKSFAHSKEAGNPLIRSDALKKLIEISQKCFPAAEHAFPNGSFYKTDGDAVFYIIEKSSVALRSSIEFMEEWFGAAIPNFPDCRLCIDRGFVDTVPVPERVELTGKPFENISYFEKDVEAGAICLTAAVVATCDPTMAKFVFLRAYTPRPSENIKLLRAEYLNPRTVADSALVHALFIAHPTASEARKRVIELFLLEYLIEKQLLSDLNIFCEWANKKNYSVPPFEHLQEILNSSEMFDQVVNDRTTYQLSAAAIQSIDKARIDFSEDRENCLSNVKESLTKRIDANASNNIDLAALIEDYLCAVFSEIRLMANYFRETYHIFESGSATFKRFEFIIKKYIGEIRYFDQWVEAFLWGLKDACEQENRYVAAVFHNVLATYYLNRSSQPSAYQIDKLKKRQIFLDTNVLYSLIVPASNFYEQATYLVSRLAKLGVEVKVFPPTIEEYEHSLDTVRKNNTTVGPNAFLIRWNPWIYQEFKKNPSKYLKKIEICLKQHSLLDKNAIAPEDIPLIQERLSKYGLTLETNFVTYSEQEVMELWSELRNAMANWRWDLNRYWEFIYSQSAKQEFIIKHDVTCIENLAQMQQSIKGDELGPVVMFLTLDSKILRLRSRERYRFVLSLEQALEILLPYLFISDIPLSDAGSFPNQLLSTQLGTLLVQKPPDLVEEIKAFLREPDVFDGNKETLIKRSADMATILSDDRYRKIAQEIQKIRDEGLNQKVAETIAASVEEIERERRSVYFSNIQKEKLIEASKREVEKEKEKEIKKLRKTINYWKAQARKR